MHPASQIARWYRRVDSSCFTNRHPSFTLDEVRHLLVSEDPEQAERAESVREVAAAPTTWLGYVDERQRRVIGALVDRLPSLVYLYRRGESPEDMLARYGGLTPYRYDQALNVASACIARRLNTAGA
ncbi:MAG: hypothetical protein H0U79_02795 [Solirubrobacterales bacterium]|nr:hypothetical protein [Solirubrobacterales bacterium]